MLVSLLLTVTSHAMSVQDPPKSPIGFYRKVTIRFIEPDGTEKFIQCTGEEAKTHVNETTGQLIWMLQSKPPRRAMRKGDLIIPEDGDDKGTVYKVVRVSADTTCTVEKQAPK